MKSPAGQLADLWGCLKFTAKVATGFQFRTREFFEKSTIEELHNLTPRLIASESEKLENGKPRAIFGWDVVSYFIISHILRFVEPKLNSMVWESLKSIWQKHSLCKDGGVG